MSASVQLKEEACEEARKTLWLLVGVLYYAGEKLAARALLEASRLRREEDVHMIHAMLSDVEVELPYDELRELFGEGIAALAENMQKCVEGREE